MITYEEARKKLDSSMTEKQYHYARHLTDREMGICTVDCWLRIFSANFDFVKKNNLVEV